MNRNHGPMYKNWIQGEAGQSRMLNKPASLRLLRRIDKHDANLDFRRFSAALNPRLQGYGCSIEALSH